MPGKYTEGYTKSAQKTKFIRHRDVKMKEKELRKEVKIQKLMCEGICRRCREKVQWRFKFDKYKPLKNPATCQQCKQKTITKAYRTLCDSCGSKRGVCPSCCLNPEENALLDEEEKKLAPKDFKLSSSSSLQQPQQSERNMTNKAMAMEMDEEDRSNNQVAEEGDEEEEEQGEGDDEIEADEQAEEEGEDGEGENLSLNEAEMEQEHAKLEEALQVKELGMDIKWDEKKFVNIASSKYSKNRVVDQF